MQSEFYSTSPGNPFSFDVDSAFSMHIYIHISTLTPGHRCIIQSNVSNKTHLGKFIGPSLYFIIAVSQICRILKLYRFILTLSSVLIWKAIGIISALKGSAKNRYYWTTWNRPSSTYWLANDVFAVSIICRSQFHFARCSSRTFFPFHIVFNSTSFIAHPRFLTCFIQSIIFL